jgi:SAM-dependent methyltransferase
MEESTFAQLYDAYISQFDEDLPFWISLAQTSGSPILELGCGTGRVLLELAKSGFEIEGIDCDPAMLEIARSKLIPGFQDQIKLHIEDVRNFSISESFALIIIPCNTFAYFNQEESEQILKRSSSHLNPGGQLVIDLPNPAFGSHPDAYDLLDDETNLLSSFTSPRSKLPVQVSARSGKPSEASVVDITWFFDELRPDGQVQRFEHEIRYHLRSAQLMTKMLNRTGFNNVSVLGDYDSSPSTTNSQRLIIKGQIDR